MPYLLTTVSYKPIYIDSAQVGLGGTASMSDFPVVYVLTNAGQPHALWHFFTQ